MKLFNRNEDRLLDYLEFMESEIIDSDYQYQQYMEDRVTSLEADIANLCNKYSELDERLEILNYEINKLRMII